MRLEVEGKSPASQYVVMEMLSDKYGWTPKQIREMSVIDINNYLTIINTKASIQKHNSMKYER